MTNNSNKTIAKNTILLYFRMLFSMAVSLYTSRIILQVLGVEDYGIYQTVGGLIGLVSFLNGALSSGTSRFLTYEMGTGCFERLKKTFSSVLTVHILLALFLVFLAETVGLWFLYNKLVIPETRMDAAVFVYHMTAFCLLFSITQVPFGAVIVAHERMNIYAYVTIVDVILKLAIVYMLQLADWDKLKYYSCLLILEQIGIMLFYRFYCIRNFEESRYQFTWDKGIIKGVLSYSGWNLISNISTSLIGQGGTVLINMFFNPSVVAARAIANQVNMAAFQFIGNFRTAANPQVVKRYAAKDFEGSRRLLLLSTRFSFYVMLLLALPICLVSRPLLTIWLGTVPEYATEFLQLTMITSLFTVFDLSFYTALYAKGQIKENAILCPALEFVAFPIIYLMFRMGASPMAYAWCVMFLTAIIGMVLKPWLVVRIVGYRWSEIIAVFISCAKVFIFSIPVPVILCLYRGRLFISITQEFIILVIVSVLSVSITVWFVGMNKELRQKLLSFLRNKINGK